MTERHTPRILMVTTRAFPEIGGIEAHVAEVAALLGRSGFEVEVLTTDRSGALPTYARAEGYDVRRCRAYPRGRDYYLSPGLFWHVLRSDADLVHVQGIHTLVPPLAMLAAVLRRLPFVVTFHTGGSSSRLRTRARSLQFGLLAPLLRRARALVAVSDFEARLFERVTRSASGSIRVIRNGGSLPSQGPALPAQPGLVVSTGRLERYKGHHRVIEALPQLLSRHPEARVRILGSGPEEGALRALAQRLGVGDRVSIDYIPPVERAAMSTALSAAAVVALVSDYEAHPVAVMEALSLGRPVVVARTSGLSELADLGWVVAIDPAAGPEQLVDALDRQLTSPLTVPPGDLPTWESCAAELGQVYAALGQTQGEPAVDSARIGSA